MTIMEMMLWSLRNMEATSTFSRADLRAEMARHGDTVSTASFNAGIDRILRCGKIARAGRNSYYIPPAYMRIYKYVYSKTAQRLAQWLGQRYPYVDIVIFELFQLNEFVNHQLAHNTLFVYVESPARDFVFDALKENYDGVVLLKPSTKEYDRYWKADAIIVKQLVSETPLDRRAKWKSRLEKILVDLFADKILRDLFSSAEVRRIYQDSFRKYVIDESCLFRYAKRRGKAKCIRQFILEETDIVLRGR